MDRILRSLWVTTINVGGSVFDTSTCANILKEIKSNYDYEKANRLKKRDNSLLKQHAVTFKVYLKSCELRYYVEIIYAVLLMGLYSWDVIKYVQIWASYEDIKERFFYLYNRVLGDGTATIEETSEFYNT